ncbi:MAG TPA: ATP-binding protein [Gemmatimonadaceae bacterium]|jgi:signal transduction histidine kinase
MSAPPFQSDSGIPTAGAERQVLDAAIALAPTISLERVVHETAQQLRRVVAYDAIAIALSDAELRPFELVHHSGFEKDSDAVMHSLVPLWKRALGDSQPIVRELPYGHELTVPMASGVVRGAITVVLHGADTTQRMGELESLVAGIARQAATAIDRARDVDRLAHRQRLEAIGEVSAGIAREMRNPLFGISSAAQLLRFRVRDDPVIERNVGRILREVERLNGVVSSLLEYGHPAPMQTAPADPDTIWHTLLLARRGLLESRALVVRHHPAEPRSTCEVDSEQIGVVFSNVLSNAVDAAPEGSDLTLTSASMPKGTWRCRLHNEGAPISPEVLAHVFDLFFSTKPAGAGVGLALCRRILDDHSGTISLESTADSGTTVTITLPNRKINDLATADKNG